MLRLLQELGEAGVPQLHHYAPPGGVADQPRLLFRHLHQSPVDQRVGVTGRAAARRTIRHRSQSSRWLLPDAVPNRGLTTITPPLRPIARISEERREEKEG